MRDLCALTGRGSRGTPQTMVLAAGMIQQRSLPIDNGQTGAITQCNATMMPSIDATPATTATR